VEEEGKKRSQKVDFYRICCKMFNQASQNYELGLFFGTIGVLEIYKCPSLWGTAMHGMHTRREGVMSENRLQTSRRRALILAMNDRNFTIRQLAEAVAKSPESIPDEVNRINRIRRRDTNSILLRQADAKRYALALEVSVNRLLAGELTVEESAASGGNEGAKKAGKSKQEDLTVRKKVGSERLQALKKALGRRSYGQLHSDLTAAQKQQWSLAMVKSYVLGKAFPNKEFLTDVAHVLGVSVISLTIRDSPLENLGRRCITGTISDPGKNHAVLHIPGIPVTITSEGLGLNHKDHIDFDVETRSFAGQIFRVTGSVADGYSLTATIPLGEVAKNALLGLVTQ
jgi:hypothetical protein